MLCGFHRTTDDAGFRAVRTEDGLVANRTSRYDMQANEGKAFQSGRGTMLL